MVDFFELEQKCKKFQRKRVVKLIIATIVGVGGGAIIGLYLTDKKTEKRELKQVVKKESFKKEHKVVSKKIEKVVVKEKNETKKELKQVTKNEVKNEVKKEIKNRIVVKKREQKNSEKNDSIKKEKNDSSTKLEIPILKVDIDFDKIESKESVENSKKEVKKEEVVEQNKKRDSKILQTTPVSFEKAMKLIVLYYENGDYENSMKWCKIASKIDNYNENVWYYYGLNLEKVGKKEKAIQVLTTYLKYQNSKKIRFLLQRLISE
jgi:tetratricopeptide (TPR) repeat protein